MGLHVGAMLSIAEHHPEGYAKDLTLRYPVYAPFSGSALRFTLDNFCGKGTCHHPPGNGGGVCSDLTGKVPLSCLLTAGTIRDITFDGSHSVTLGSGRVRHKRRPLLSGICRSDALRQPVF